MKLKTANFRIEWALSVAVLMVVSAVFTVGCASRPERGPSSYSDFEPNGESRQHPASYFIDRFNVEKERPERPPANQPFFFKRCYEVGQRFPHTATSYDCDYTL